MPDDCTVVGVPGRVVRMKNKMVPRETLDQINLPDPIQDDLRTLQKANNELINRLLLLEDEVRRLEKASATVSHIQRNGREELLIGNVGEGETIYIEDRPPLEYPQPEPDRNYVEVDDCVFADYI